MINFDIYNDEFFIVVIEAELLSNFAKENLKDQGLPKMFNKAFQTPNWCDAINNENSALRKRNVWMFVSRTANFNVIHFAWVFCFKPLYISSNKVLRRARSCIQRDYQQVSIDLDAFSAYFHVASNEETKILFVFATPRHLIVKEEDVCCAYLYGYINYIVFIAQPTDSSGKKERSGYLRKLNVSMYSIKQASRI